MASYRLEHVGVVVSPAKLDETRRFYESIFGWNTLREMPGAIFIGDGSGGRIEFLVTDAAPLNPPSHLAFVVPLSEFDTIMANIKGAGVAADEPRDNPSGDRLFFFSDPAGNRAQIVGRTNPMPG